jgi:hypothetical protein
MKVLHQKQESLKKGPLLELLYDAHASQAFVLNIIAPLMNLDPAQFETFHAGLFEPHLIETKTLLANAELHGRQEWLWTSKDQTHLNVTFSIHADFYGKNIQTRLVYSASCNKCRDGLAGDWRFK